MRAFWDDGGSSLAADQARPVSLEEACRLWSDLRGSEGSFLGLIDDRDRTIQFYFDGGIPDDVEDARHLRIVLMDLPEPEKGGSHGRQVAVGDVQRLIGRAFELGADHRHFGGLTFTSW
ncbi:MULTISPECIES: hypothetical protein [Methylobacterium]|uniref:GNAT family N-acetyltransferase n=1 Tax=Methylobacterium jeotgali TaxID=381630 RepID=A0ABQ4SZ19_9HYPH|nr:MULTISPECIES: hypothetical protein [Methylobacterium]PIU06355.1 MAG: hypothetical protein COT56_11150 [Methylobacterium sp. CG09_land_8_20_14_0_10_71_15]PIU13678.1 MAG: hypothetical protein COT28_10625 [Methylobacterium sp. CG08_land_8_20_14_0_20_71_15]GBU17415.1 hypothetical protein AwMethylo_16300 [Methylobacterium sp.]GJE08337.1 hypothetical protein AOPFMNJM_3674 [Methylobacterium jeotgali]